MGSGRAPEAALWPQKSQILSVAWLVCWPSPTQPQPSRIPWMLLPSQHIIYTPFTSNRLLAQNKIPFGLFIYFFFIFPLLCSLHENNDHLSMQLSCWWDLLNAAVLMYVFQTKVHIFKLLSQYSCTFIALLIKEVSKSSEGCLHWTAVGSMLHGYKTDLFRLPTLEINTLRMLCLITHLAPVGELAGKSQPQSKSSR